MMKRWIGLLIVILGLLPFTAAAQDAALPELTETFTTDTYSFKYPADWTPSAEHQGNFSIPIAGEGAVGDGIAISRDDLTATFTLLNQEGTTAHDLAASAAQDWAKNVPDYTTGLTLDLTINEREATFVDVNGIFPLRFVAASLGHDRYLQLMLVGVSEQFTAAMPVLWAVFDTARLKGDDTPLADTLEVHYTLTQNHQRKNGWDFSIPADWQTQEAESYTLLVIPGMETTIGISAIHDLDAADPHVWASQVHDNVMEAAPGAESEALDLTIGEYPAFQENFRIVSDNLGYTQFVAYAGEDIQISVSVIGPLAELPALLPVVLDIIPTVRITH